MKDFVLATLLVAVVGLAAGPAFANQTILVFGDSLSAGYGIRQDAAWPALLERRLSAERADYNVVNVSISGETTAGGRSRLPAALDKHRPKIVVIALGANDGLRGLPLDAMEANLSAMVDRARQAGARVLLVGMRLPPNYGDYASAFARVFESVARHKKIALVPFLLDGIADQAAFFQADALHPTAAAQPLILDTVNRGLQPLLK